MPNSPFSTKNSHYFAKIRQFLSEERLKDCTEQARSEAQAIELHQEKMKLNAQLMAIVGTIEIALRNMVATNLNAHFGESQWLKASPKKFTWHIKEAEKIRDTLYYMTKKQSRYPYTDSDVTSNLSFFFWKRLYSKDYKNILWPILKSTFPADGDISREKISAHLEVLYQARNKLAHHEFVFGKRFKRVVKSIDFIVNNLGATGATPAPLARLLADDIDNARNTHRRIKKQYNC